MAVTSMLSVLLALAPAPDFETGLDVVSYSVACHQFKNARDRKVKEAVHQRTPVSGENLDKVIGGITEQIESEAAKQCKGDDKHITECIGAEAVPKDLASATQALHRLAEVLDNDVPQECDGTEAKQRTMPAAVGAAWQDAVIRGIAGFVVKRARAEALAFVLQTVSAELCDVKPKGSAVLPATCAVLGLNPPQSDVSVWGTVKGGLELDFPELPVRLLEQLATDNPKVPNLAEASLLVAEVAGAVRALRRGDGVRDVFVALKRLGQKPSTPALEAEAARQFLYATGLVVNLVGARLEDVDVGDDEVFVKVAVARFEEHTADLNEWIPRCRLGTETTLRSDACKAQLGGAFRRVRAALVAMEKVPKSLDPSSPEAERTAVYARYVQAMAPVFQAVLDIFKYDPVARDGATKPDTKGVVVFAVTEMTAMLAVVDRARERDYTAALAALLRIADGMGFTDTLPSWLTKYGSFLAQVATVETSEEMQKALESVAEPVGSYRAKRGSPRFDLRTKKHDAPGPYRTTLSVNAYLGVQGGVELVFHRELQGLEPAPRMGLFAPVGLELSRGFRESGSVGGFISVIDVGALVDYRLGPAPGESTSAQPGNEPNLTFAQVVSPGLYWVLGIPRTPLTLGLGLAYTPKLRSIIVGGQKDDTTADALRFSGFLAIDIPVFIVSRGGKKKDEKACLKDR
jgi:hypothetical protein